MALIRNSKTISAVFRNGKEIIKIFRSGTVVYEKSTAKHTLTVMPDDVTVTVTDDSENRRIKLEF